MGGGWYAAEFQKFAIIVARSLIYDYSLDNEQSWEVALSIQDPNVFRRSWLPPGLTVVN